jgi:carboxylesterase type B
LAHRGPADWPGDDTDALPKWPRFNTEKRPTMIFDLPPRIENDPRSEERKLFGERIN